VSQHEPDERLRTGPCQGSCEEHIGEPSIVHVGGWGYFRYCEAAIAEDRRRGLSITEPETEKS